MFNLLTKFHSLIVFTSWDIGQYVYRNCLLASCDVINFEPYLSNQAVFYMAKNLRQKIKYLENEKSF